MNKPLFGLAKATAAHAAERNGTAPVQRFSADAPLTTGGAPAFTPDELAEAVGMVNAAPGAFTGRLWELVQPVFTAQREAQWLLGRRGKLVAETQTDEQKRRDEQKQIEDRLLELQRVAAYSAPGFSGIDKAIFAGQRERQAHTFSAGAVMSTLRGAKDAWTDTANLPVTLADWRIALDLPGGSAGAILEKLRYLNDELLKRAAKQVETFSVRLNAAHERLTSPGCGVRDLLASVVLLEEGKTLLGRR